MNYDREQLHKHNERDKAEDWPASDHIFDWIVGRRGARLKPIKYAAIHCDILTDKQTSYNYLSMNE